VLSIFLPNTIYLYHKTTRRTVYEQAKNGIDHFDDVILWNKNNEITESTIANIVFKEKGIYYTPPVSSGLLGGTYRQWLLEAGKILERRITKDQLRETKDIYLINSVREWRKAVLK
jgi:para-aminobenzoate synthetase/4-amino-4-deoxychorismate lyase